MQKVGLAAIVAFIVSGHCFAQSWSRDADGKLQIKPVPVDKSLRNEWPAEWEQDFWRRAQIVVEQTARGGKYGNTFFENEKRAYGWAMLSMLGGYEEPALKFLQSPDNPGEWSAHTYGIDLYPSFTLKHQVRKYFFFGNDLDDDYRKRMQKAFKVWTERDPLRRPNPVYTGAEIGWGPDKFNSWVDIRSTDNLKLMREVAVYLFAEEAGNRETQQIYRERLSNFITTLYRQGQGEWDSENYLGHSVAALLSLYDFAKDREMQRQAKAALDWITTCAALKYWRGNYNGPSRRDYNHPAPFGGSAATLCWLWFGDTPTLPPSFESDEIHVITSCYRPPAAVVQLARKKFARPAEIISGKPAWSCWQNPAAESPEQYETHYFGRTFQLGTLLQGTQSPDINGFKALVYSSQRGADQIVAGPVSDPCRLGSPQYESHAVAPHNAVGQNGNVAIYLARQSDHPYLFQVPNDAQVKTKPGVTIVACEKTTIAIWPINLESVEVDEQLTKQAQWKQSKNGKSRERYLECKILSAKRKGEGTYGFAIEFCENYRQQFAAAATKLKPEVQGKPNNRAAAITGVGGRRVRLQWGEVPHAIGVWRDGQQLVLDQFEIFRTISDKPLVQLQWQGDQTLSVRSSSYEFRTKL